jgi:predicted aspartyl protease
MRLRTGSLPPANGKDIIPYTTQPDADFKVLQVSPMVTIKLADQSFPALIDTGAHAVYGDVIVPPEVAAKLPLSNQLGTVTIGDALGRHFPGVVKQLNGDLTIGGVVIHKSIVTVSEWLGFVNVGPATKRFALTIDQKNHLVQLTLPTSESTNRKN